MKTTHEHHSHHVCQGIGEQSVYLGAPVADNKFDEFFVEVEGQEATDDRQPNDGKKHHIIDDVEHFISRRQAEPELKLGEHDEEEVLEVALEEHGGQEDQRTESSEKFGHAIIEAQVEEGEGDDHKDEIEGEKLVAGRHESLTLSLHNFVLIVSVI